MYGHRVDQVFLNVDPLRQTLRRIVQLYRYYCLYDQWSAIEFLGDEMHGAAVFSIAGVQRADACVTLCIWVAARDGY